MPATSRFAAEEDYWATLAHETVHWTRHKDRLARNLGRQSWGDDGYAREELVAELGSAFLCSELGLAPVVRADHAQYMSAWLKQLDGDPQAVLAAAHHASKAVTWLGERVHAVRIERERVRAEVGGAVAGPVPAPTGWARESAQGQLALDLKRQRLTECLERPARKRDRPQSQTPQRRSRGRSA